MKEIYHVLAAAMGQETRMNQIANNLANSNTVGFKRDGVVFRDFLKLAQAPIGADGFPPTAIPMADQGYIDFAAGPAMATGRQLDVMIEGQGFFQVETEEGQGNLFTRAGDLQLNEQRELTTADGRKLLGTGGTPIKIPNTGDEIAILTNGDVMVGPQKAGRIGVFKFADPGRLAKVGHSLFRAPANMQAEPDDSSTVRQSALEGSNASPIEEMSRMIETQRAYETHQKAIQAIDETIGRRIASILNS